MPRRILIVSYHFYPDSEIGARRVSELARYLCGQGLEVVVLAARSARYIHTDPALALRLPDLRIVTVPVPPKLLPALLPWLKRLRRRPRAGAGSAAAAEPAPAAGESRMARLRRYYLSMEGLVDNKKLWSAMAALRLWRLGLARPFDAVISSGPPMSAHVATWLARPVLRGRWIMDLRDPWVYDSDWRGDVQSGLSRRIDAWLERRCARRADRIITTTEGLASALRARYPGERDSVHTVFNGFGARLSLGPPPGGRLSLLYAGTLYYNRDPFPLLRALAALVRQPDVDPAKVSMTLVGNCRQWGGIDVARWAAEHGIAERIDVRPPVPAGEVPALMRRANVLVNFAQGQLNQVPAKMFDYIASGREMLLVTEPHSDSARVALQAGCARVVDSDDEAGLRAVLRRLYQDYVIADRPPRLDDARVQVFSRDNQNARFLGLLADPAPAQRAAASPALATPPNKLDQG